MVEAGGVEPRTGIENTQLADSVVPPRRPSPPIPAMLAQFGSMSDRPLGPPNSEIHIPTFRRNAGAARFLYHKPAQFPLLIAQCSFDPWQGPAVSRRRDHCSLDDFVVGFQYEDDGRRFLLELRGRFQRFSLELQPEKTRLIRFGRFARRDSRRFDGRRKPETFNFLGSTHACGVNREGKFLVRRTTMKRRLAAKHQEVKAELRMRMHQPIPEHCV
jgi:hypothetical protein